MKKEQIQELMNAWKAYFPEESLVLMTFNPAKIGIFTEEAALEAALRKRSVQMVYSVVNRPKDECLASLPQNQLVRMEKGAGISSKDIGEYRYFFVDVDVLNLQIGGKKRNATEEEHEKARKTAFEAKAFLKEKGFPDPILTDSGNGFHLLYSMNLPMTEESDRLLKAAVTAIGERVDNRDCKIDTVVADRGRKIKLPGSINNPGEETTRMAFIVENPGELKAVTAEMIKNVAALAKKKRGWQNSPKTEEEEESEMDRVLNLAEEVGEFFVADNGQAFANVQIEDGRKITLNLTGKKFAVYFRKQMKVVLKIRTVGAETWRQILEYLQLLAEENRTRVPIYNRVGKLEDAIYYDLQTDDFKAVKIAKDGYDVVDTPPGVFQRNTLDREQVEPEFDESVDLVDELSQLLNFRSLEAVELFSLWLVSCFIPGTTHPLLWISGAHASGKSTLCSIVQDLVSPQVTDRSGFPRKVDDLYVRLANRVICVFDNCGGTGGSGISEQASNALCIAVTGGSIEKRKLYTDMDIVNIPLKSIIVINSCENILEKPDLLSRTIHFDLKTIEGEILRTDEEIWERYIERKPYILGCIFATIPLILESWDEEEEIKYATRLASFQQLATKIAKHFLGKDSSYVTYLLEENKRMIDIEQFENNPTAVLISHFMANQKKWQGSVSELYNQLENLAFKLGIERNSKNYPKNPASLSYRLNGIIQILEKRGIAFETRNVGMYKQITLANHSLDKNLEKRYNGVPPKRIKGNNGVLITSNDD